MKVVKMQMFAKRSWYENEQRIILSLILLLNFMKPCFVKRKLYQDFIFLRFIVDGGDILGLKNNNTYSIFLIFIGIEKEDSGIKKRISP